MLLCRRERYRELLSRIWSRRHCDVVVYIERKDGTAYAALGQESRFAQAFDGVLSMSEQSVEATENQVGFGGSSCVLLSVEVQGVGWSSPRAIRSVSSVIDHDRNLLHYCIVTDRK